MLLHTEVTRALGPIMTFLNDHVDTALQRDLDHIATDENMPIYQRVKEATIIIGSKCLGDPVTTRKRLVDRLSMGTASTAADVLTALDNFDIILDQMQLHYDTVTATVDEAATNRAREDDENAEPVFKECQPPPTRQERITYLQDTLDLRSTEISAIVNQFYDLQESGRPWDNMVSALKAKAEKIAGDSERASKRLRIDDGAAGGKSAHGSSSSSNSSSSGSSSSDGGSGHGTSSGGSHLAGSAGYGFVQQQHPHRSQQPYQHQHQYGPRQQQQPYYPPQHQQQYGPQQHQQPYYPPQHQQQYGPGQQQQPYYPPQHQQQQYGPPPPPPHTAPTRSRTPSPSRTRSSGPVGTPY